MMKATAAATRIAKPTNRRDQKTTSAHPACCGRELGPGESACPASSAGTAGDGVTKVSAEGSRHSADRKRDSHPGFGALLRVVLIEQRSQPPGLDTDDRIVLRIEILRPSENVDRDGISLDARGVPGKRLFDDVLEKARELRGTSECIPDEKLLQGRLNLNGGGLSRCHRAPPCNLRLAVSLHVISTLCNTRFTQRTFTSTANTCICPAVDAGRNSVGLKLTGDCGN